MPLIIALVVTYNRKNLLRLALASIANQTLPVFKLLIVDNASTDGTCDVLADEGWLDRPDVELLKLGENTGGAGGFSIGLSHAMAQGADWVWMMDDDALPQLNALEHLIKHAHSRHTIYGSIAVADGNLSWPLHTVDNRSFMKALDVPDAVYVTALPFLGFFVSSDIVRKIGLPDADYFIAGDDFEYCLRARRAGIDIQACGESIINHPPSSFYQFGIGKIKPTCFRISPWKRYYDVRNRIITSSVDGWYSVIFKTLPATVLRWIATLINEPDGLMQTKAYWGGVVDGLKKNKGKRHQKWGL